MNWKQVIRLALSGLASLLRKRLTRMTLKRTWIGPRGPYQYQDSDTYAEDGEVVEGLRVDDQIRVGAAPTEDYHVVRKQDLDAKLTTLRVNVASIANPAAELASLSGEEVGDLLLAYQDEVSTLYAWSDEALTAGVPQIVAGDGGFWVAVAGRYAKNSYITTLQASDLAAGTISGVESITTIGVASLNKLVLPKATQAIDAVGDTIGAGASYLHITDGGTGPYTLTSTPTIAAGTAGQILILTAAQADAAMVTLQDENTLADSGLKLGATTRSLGGDGTNGDDKALVLLYNGSKWIELAYASLVGAA